jgi:hypothetical protein
MQSQAGSGSKDLVSTLSISFTERSSRVRMAIAEEVTMNDTRRRFKASKVKLNIA